jgi:hypothetical protein
MNVAAEKQALEKKTRGLLSLFKGLDKENDK